MKPEVFCVSNTSATASAKITESQFGGNACFEVLQLLSVRLVDSKPMDRVRSVSSCFEVKWAARVSLPKNVTFSN